MRKIAQLILSSFLLFLFSCSDHTENQRNCMSDVDSESIYDIEIQYTYFKRDITIPKRCFNDKYLNDGNLYLHFETQFNRDKVCLKLNDIPFKDTVITTDNSTGVAWSLKLNDIEEISSVGISINNGNEAYFKVLKSNQISIEYYDTLLLVRHLANVPYYD